MSMYVLAENEGKPALECINESKTITNGHKMELFILNLSFIGWILLAIITFGIACIWIVPYMNATFANTYRSLKPVSFETVNSPEFIPATEPVKTAAEDTEN